MFFCRLSLFGEKHVKEQNERKKCFFVCFFFDKTQRRKQARWNNIDQYKKKRSNCFRFWSTEQSKLSRSDGNSNRIFFFWRCVQEFITRTNETCACKRLKERICPFVQSDSWKDKQTIMRIRINRVFKREMFFSVIWRSSMFVLENISECRKFTSSQYFSLFSSIEFISLNVSASRCSFVSVDVAIHVIRIDEKIRC